MKDRISKKDFNKKMKELEKENQSIDTKMSSYYKSPGGDLFETIVFNLAFVLLNALVLTYLYMYLTSQEYGIYKWSAFVTNVIDTNIPLCMLIFALGIVLCKILVNAVILRCTTKHFRLGLSYRLFTKDVLYSVLGYNLVPVYEYTLTTSRVKLTTAENVVNVKSIGKIIAILVVSIVLSIVSFIYVDTYLNIIVCVINFVSVIIFAIIIGIILGIIINKDTSSVLVFNICKILFKLKLVKDFDYIYNLISLKIISLHNTITDAKDNFIGVAFSFIEYVIVFVVKCSAVMLLFENMLVTLTFEKCIYIALAINIIDNIGRLYPIKNKTILREILLFILFASLGIRGYMFYFIIIYSILDYYGPLVIGLVLNLIDKLVLSKTVVFNSVVTNSDVKSRYKKEKSGKNNKK